MSGELARGRRDVLFRQLDDEWVLFDPASDRLHTLNLTAALVWSHLDGALDEEEIAREVGAAFEPPVSGPAVAADVREVLRRFRAEGLLEP
jgi:hypothetical protein